MRPSRDLPPRGAARLARVLMVAAFSVAGGAGAGFLALVFAAVAGGELDPVTWNSGDIDAMLRQGVAAAGVVVAAGLAVGVLAQGAFRLLYVRQLARAAEADPARVVAWSGRAVTVVPSPFSSIYIFGAYFLILGLIGIVIFALVVGASPDDRGIAVTVLVVAVVVWLVMAGLVVLAATAGVAAWKRAVARVQAVWGDRMPTLMPPTVVPRDAAFRVGQVGGVVGAIGFVTFLIGLVTRQPCRRCDPVSYNEFGERAIDVVMAIAIPTTAVALLALLVSLVLRWVTDVNEVATVARRAREGDPAPAPEVLARLLSGRWPGRTAGAALVFVGGGFAAIVARADAAAPGILSPALVPILLAVGVVGLAVLWWAEGAAAVSRNRWREAWELGDLAVTPAEPSRAARRTSRRQRT